MVEENNCNFICSVGFRKSCNFYSLKDDNRYLDEINFKNIKDNDILYIKTDSIRDFYNNINKLEKEIILVSGCSDYTIPNDFFTNEEFIELLNNKKIIHYYSQNCIFKHEKITNLPIGLDYHTMSKQNIYWGNIKTPLEQEKELLDIRSNMKEFYNRELKIYSNCHFFINTKFGYDRKDALNKIPNELLYLEPMQINRRKSWENQINYSFVLSPHGNGLDCHRTWEALILGCIPIVKKSFIDDLYIDLPVLIVNDWSDINKELLNETVNKFRNIIFCFEKLELKYWINKMKYNNFTER